MAGTIPDEGQRRRRRGEPTVARIAQLAGVSAPTVSKVLNGRSGVGLETRRRVEALLHEHGYRRPSPIVSAPSVEVVFYALESNLAIEIMRGVEKVAQARQIAVGFTEVVGREGGRIATAATRPASPGRAVATRRTAVEGLTWADQLLARRPLGVIVVHSHFTARQHAQLAASAIPLVALDPTGEPLHATPSVGATNWSGGVAATRHLLDLGHRRIGVISGPAEYLCARARLEACRAAMDTAGTPLDERLVRTGQFAFDDGLALGRELLALPDRPTAIFCGDDLQALGVYEAARLAGLRIPDDLSVVGFDDMEYARWCGPAMTTVRQPFSDMGATAADLVLALAAGEKPAHTRIELATTLVVRDSTAPPRGAETGTAPPRGAETGTAPPRGAETGTAPPPRG